MLKFNCADVGFDCGLTTIGDTQKDILHNCAAHAQKDHRMKLSDFTEKLNSKIKANTYQAWNLPSS